MKETPDFDGADCLKRIIRRGRKVIAECNQICIDANYWAGLPHNQKHKPIDTEQERVLAFEMAKSVKQAEQVLLEKYGETI